MEKLVLAHRKSAANTYLGHELKINRTKETKRKRLMGQKRLCLIAFKKEILSLINYSGGGIKQTTKKASNTSGPVQWGREISQEMRSDLRQQQ